MSRALTYDPVGATDPAAPLWGPTPSGFRRHEETVRIGHGIQAWATARDELMAWQIKRRSGFEVSTPVARLGDVVIRARIGPFRILEPARVVAVVDVGDRVGFAYGTCEGHPVRGEEAFVLSRDGDGFVDLTLRSLTAPPRGGAWRVVYPFTLVAQVWYRRRYRRALSPGGPGTERSWRRAVGFLVVALLLIALGCLGTFDPGGYVVVRAAFDHVFVFGVLAALAGGLGLRELVHRPSWAASIPFTLGIVVAILWGVVGVFAWLLGRPSGATTMHVPNRPYDVQVESESAVIDPVYVVYVRQPRGLLSRQWRVACTGEGDPRSALRRARWTADGQLRASLFGNEHELRISVDPISGRPRNVSPYWRC